MRLENQVAIITEQGGASGDAELAVFLGSDESGSLSGRLIKVGDDFANLRPRIPGIMAADVYTLRRVESE